jgi:3-hydroxybutyryl-CoA dehydrogenase
MNRTFGQYQPPHGGAMQVVGVVGAGAMGAGIAQVAALAGHQVLVYDVDAAGARRAVADISARLDSLVDKDRLDAGERDDAIKRLAVVSELDLIAPAGLVIEAAAESLDIKREIFARLEEACADDAILATNTSSISVTAIGAALRRPERLVGMHFFNPAPVMRLVEVVSGLATDPAVAAAVAATATAWGKVAVSVASTPGFVVNRVARPYYGEALRVFEEGGADPATIDAVLRESGGFRIGPFALMDLVGLDVNLAVSRSVWQAFHHDPRYTPSLSQRELVDAGRLGRKSGRGWYRYDGTPDPAPSTAEPSAAEVPANLVARGALGPLTPLLGRLSDAGIVVAEHPGLRGQIEVPGGGVIKLTDGRLATTVATEMGKPVVLLDLALDFGTATRFAIAASDGCPPGVLAMAIGLLQSAGVSVSVMDDVPGLIVARTVAMLVNEASDLVARDIATAEDVDLAMRHGVNYPIGPLAWGDRLGAGYVVRLLDNLGAVYGDGRHRASPWLRRRAVTGGALHG